MAAAYPNPVKDVLTLVGVSTQKGQLVDAKGSFVKAVEIQEGRLDVSDLRPGVYTLIVASANGTSRVGFVRQ
jgi:hypothetical protein